MVTKGALSNGRRSFLRQAGAGMLGTAGVAAVPARGAQAPAVAQWQPARHTQDDWLDQIAGQHRFVFDTTTSEGFSSALLFANNYYLANSSGYGLQNSDLAVVIIARHTSTPFAYNDAIWSKYGGPISNFVDPTKPPSNTNTKRRQLDALLNRGAHLAVCQMASAAIAGSIARAVGGTADEISKEIASNLVANAHLVPAGIVAVARAQERGYSFVVAV